MRRKVVSVILASLTFTLAGGTSLHAFQSFDGLWVTTQEDCEDRDERDSKTWIALESIVNGKPAPRIDRYEYHCRVDRQATVGNDLTLAVTCFEFESDYSQGVGGWSETIRLSSGPKGTININGQRYQRCIGKDAHPKDRK